MTAVLEETTHRPAPPRCECVHPMPWGEEPCPDTAAFEVGVDDRTVLLCVECLEGWRDDLGEDELSAREL